MTNRCETSAPIECGHRAQHFVTVAIPRPYDGVGQVLANVYRVSQVGIPDDMLALLLAIDKDS